MLQIIGWIACLYLIVKGLEMLGRKDRHPISVVGAIIAFVGTVVFFFIIEAQFEDSSPASATLADNITLEDYQRAADNLEAMADATESAAASPAAEVPTPTDAIESDPTEDELTKTELANYSGE